MLLSETETTQAIKGCMTNGNFMLDEQIEFALKEVSEQKLLCEKLVIKEDVSVLGNYASLSAAERTELYDAVISGPSKYTCEGAT